MYKMCGVTFFYYENTLFIKQSRKAHLLYRISTSSCTIINKHKPNIKQSITIIQTGPEQMYFNDKNKTFTIEPNTFPLDENSILEISYLQKFTNTIH